MSNILITGSTGMVGKGILYECLEDNTIESVTVINRSSLGINHAKLKEIILKDFMQIESIKEELNDIDACFYALGISALGLSEEQYNHITFEMTKKLADTLYELNPDTVFNFVSGTGADSSEKGRIMWARIKGKAENYVLGKGFRKAYIFRPGGIIPEKGIKSRTRLYNAFFFVFRPLFPLMKKSSGITTTTKIGRAMINSLSKPFESIHLENKEINKLAAL